MAAKDSEIKSTCSPWMSVLALLTTVHTSVFILVTVYQFNDLSDISQIDTLLEKRIADLQPNEVYKRGVKEKRQTNFIQEILTAQEKLLEQHCISKNKTCPSGERGEKGTKGNPGFPGQKGVPGIKGTTGDLGLKGAPGPKGSLGEKGSKGERGEQGAVGDPGSEGNKGPNGLPGSKGQKGQPGAKGQKGEPGVKGSPGVPGPMGAIGEKGDPGDTGLQGTMGAKGDKGPQGSPGPDRQNNAPDGCDCLKQTTTRRSYWHRSKNHHVIYPTDVDDYS